jgi:choline dehydrogenase-like flavoprotein
LSGADDIVDVLIVGAGASGAAVAWSLADTRMRILCLEQGDWMNPAEYPSTQRDWETQQWNEYAISPNQRNRPADYPINDEESPIAVANFNAVGGSTILYSAHFPRFKPSDFRHKTLDGIGDDWPISYADLDPFFAENDANIGVAGLAGDPAYPYHEPPLKHVPIGLMGETMGRGFNELGWHWWPSDSAIATEDYEGRERCANLGPCNAGCAKGAKSSADVTYWPMAQRAGVELKTNCRVREILVDEHDMATGVAYFDADGNEQVQRAEVVIVACNGVGTPRLLLNSTSSAFPNGLANRSGLVGKNLMLHPWGNVQGVFDEPLESHFGPQGCCILSQEFYETDRNRGFVRGYNMQITRGSGPIGTALNGMANGSIPWGASHHDEFARYYDRTVNLGICCEDLPEEHNTVTLDSELTDGHGIPAPKVTYRLSENSRKMLQHGLDRGVEAMEAAGAWHTSTVGPIRMAGWHLLGTARMGTDPEHSVVNEWGRSHDVKNLFIVDGSVFVTSGGVNPTTTIQAVALYIADQMKRRLANLFD